MAADPSSQWLAAYEFLIRTTADGVVLVDANTLIQRVNPAAAAMLAITPEQVIGKSPKECFRRNQSLLNLFERPGEQILDIRLPRQRMAVGIANTLVSGERMVILQDVTEKREIESHREALSKTIAHDLRNPISAMAGFIDLVTKFGDLNDQQRRFLTRARQTSAKLYDMIASLVDLAWIESGMPLKHLPIRLDDAVEKAVEVLKSLAQRQRVGITVALQRPLPVVMGDAERLHLAIYNLLHNAILYSLPESNVVIHAWGDEHEVYCSVADQGIGIADSELELIFDRMYRSSDERVREIAGGGLGLTVARTIIRRHGGDIWASSNLNEGSTFTLVLPVVRL